MDPLDVIAATRFGYGVGPGAARGRPEQMLDALSGPDRAAALWSRPKGAADAVHRGIGGLRDVDAEIRREGITEERQELRRMFLSGVRGATEDHARLSLARILDGHDPLRERLVWFWTDHLTIAARNNIERGLAPDYVDGAIRPHVTGRFADMLRAATLHPMMLDYLDQASSFGPGSPRGQRLGRGLNENHARELLELHTLGVEGRYAQDDVRQLAELMTGLTTTREMRARFDRQRVEPGPETVLGRSYGGAERADISEIEEALEALALHPDTARHLARKLAIHFVSGEPSPALVEALERAYADGGGALMPVYETLLTHPDALSGPPAKIRMPFEWMATCLRALGLDGSVPVSMRIGAFRRNVLRPLADMGQPYLGAPGPDGWPEEAGRWTEPQSLAARITWAMESPRRILDGLPDPREFVEAAVPWGPPADLRFAARAAESRRDGVGLVLVSPSLLRR